MKNEWFYISSIFIVFMFTLFISIYSTIHFESIEYMNLMMVFIVIVMVSFFLVSAVYFFSEKLKITGLTSSLFFIGILILVLYAFKAVDATNLTRYSIIYTIIVGAISCYILLTKGGLIKGDIKKYFTVSSKTSKKQVSKKPLKKEKKITKKAVKTEEGQDLKKVLTYLDKNVKKPKK